jgi:hypothetical protein
LIVRLLMVAEVTIDGQGTDRELTACAEQILDSYREVARQGVGGEFRLSLYRATPDDFGAFREKLEACDVGPAYPCFVPPQIGGIEIVFEGKGEDS